MAESLIRSGRRGRFVSVGQDMLFDQRLTLKARAIFTMMLSLPDNWEYTISGLAVKCGVSKDTIRNALNQMEKAGYLLREQTHGERGRFGGNIYILQDFSPLSEKSDNGEHRQRKTPSSVNPTQVNKDLKDKRQKKTPTPLHPLDAISALAEFTTDEGVKAGVLALLDNRLSMGKAVRTQRALDGILNALVKYSGGNEAVMVALLDKAIVSNWLTVYPLKPQDMEQFSTGSSTVVEESGVEFI